MGQQINVNRAINFRRASNYPDGTIKVLEDGRIQQTFGANLTGVEQGINKESSTQNFRIGTRRQIGNRVFYYAQAGSTQYLFPAYGVCNRNDMSETSQVVSAVASGANQVTLTAVGTVTEDEFAEGWLVVDTGTYGYFPYYQIKSNTAGASTYTVTIYDEFVHSLSTSNEYVSVMANEYKGVDSIRAYVVVNQDWPAWETYVSWVGVPPAVNSSDLTITASYYFWCQTWGPCNIMMVDIYGDSGTEKNMMFYRDGSGYNAAQGITYQWLGHLLPNSYYSAAGHGESFCMLQLNP